MAAPPADPSNPSGSSGESGRPRSGASGKGRSKADRPRRDDRADDQIGSDGDDPSGGSLRGRVLVAGRHLRDPNFHRSLVLLVEHGDDGAFGLVVNRPTATTVRRALAGHLEMADGSEPVFDGGPVEPAALFVLHNSVEFSEGELPVCSGLFVGNSRESFEGLVNAVEAGDEETRYRVFSGCAGWGPGQLEGELDRGDWRIVDADVVLDGAVDPVFGPNPYDSWETVDRLSARPPLDDAAGGDFRMN
ncbi:YqgE/AlgH family protein [Alienimonas chondri]|uniref:Uncharacterized protein n=1 Tax=Alienimonas chondri TaxID=2681879 RepID=A0ABX1V8A3_9PLAN|nr:YqgE/AlgH family protein [Alienimonas chondri]NNJ24374.1 hypothetical protein [Alienimonas chondri]